LGSRSRLFPALMNNKRNVAGGKRRTGRNNRDGSSSRLAKGEKASCKPLSGEIITVPMDKNGKPAVGKPRSVSGFSSSRRNGVAVKRDGDRFRRGDVSYRRSSSDLEQAIQRFVDLFELAPVAYVTFDRAGRIEEINRAATQLFQRQRGLLLGCPFSALVAKEDLTLFVNHLLRCRTSQEKTIETELRLKNRKGVNIEAYLVSTPVAFPQLHDGARLYQTAVVDIGERKRSEAASLRLAAIVQSSHDAIVAKDLNGIITDWNKSAERIFGYSPKEVIGKSILILIPPDRHDEEQYILDRICKGQFIDHYETIRRRKDGTLIDVALTISPVRDSAGKIVGVSKIARDITEQKQTESRLAEQACLLDLSNDAIIVRDPADRVVYWNKGAEKLYGYTWEEAAGKVTHALLKTKHPEPLPRILEALHRDSQWQGEIVHSCRDGEQVTVFSRWSLDRDAHGKPVSILESNTNITEQKKAAVALRVKQTELNLIVNETPFMLLRCGRDMRYRYASRATAEMIGRPAEEIAGKPIGDVIGRKAFETVRPYIDRVLSGETVTYEQEIPYEPFGPRFIRAVYVPDRDEQGNVIGWISSLLDVTEQKRAERSLAEAMRQQGALYEFVQRRSRAKSLDDIYSAGLDAIFSTLQCNRASIFLFSDEQQALRCVRSRGLSERCCETVGNYSPWRRNSGNLRPVCIPSVEQADLPGELKQAIRADGVAAAAFVPLIIEEKPVGRFGIYYDAPHRFTVGELDLAQTLARQLAHGIQRKRGDEALRESEARIRAVIEQTNAGIARADRTGRIVFVNRRFCEMTGYAESELLGTDVSRFTHPADKRKTADLFRNLIRTGKPFELEKRYVRKDGSTLWVSVSASAVRDVHFRINSVLAVVMDVTQRKEAEAGLRKSKGLLEKLVRQRTKALRASNIELQNEIARRKGLEGELLAVSDREQQRIGRELHDGVCQQLTAIGFLARAMALRLKNHRVIQVEDLDKIARLVNKSVMDARAIARDLHKEEVDAAGFARALRDLAERKVWKTRCRLEMKTRLNLEDDKAASELYRILREALINVDKHANATDTVLEVCRRRGKLVFSVTDNGIGINAKPKLEEGLGFHIMKYRAKSIGARLEFETPRGGGTRVACYLPLSK
jgi:PAS domain S-box-containing protein